MVADALSRHSLGVLESPDNNTPSPATSPPDQLQPRPLRLRHGAATDQGRRSTNEDVHVAVDVLCASVPGSSSSSSRDDATPSGLYAVFDGHCGASAARFAAGNIIQAVTSSLHFPGNISASLVDAFMCIDKDYWRQQLQQQQQQQRQWRTARCQTGDCSCKGAGCSSGGSSGVQPPSFADDTAGTTAVAAVVWGRALTVANAGDSRAILSRRGRAIELTRDHKPEQEVQRIEAAGGFVCNDGLLCGELGVARAIGDHHLPLLKRHDSTAPGGAAGPLTPEPEVCTHTLTAEDEFMLLASDGLWDVFPSQRAVELARARLRVHNDATLCAQELVAEALRMHSADNVTVVCVCFHDEPPVRRIYGSSRQQRSSSLQALGSPSSPPALVLQQE